jgi:competence protein ComEC
MNIRKNFLGLLLSFITIISIPGIANASSTNVSSLKIHYIDCGQGDSTLIQVGNENILIDSGNNDSKAYDYLKGRGITKLNIVIATHPHADHIGGMKKILENIEVGNFYAPKVTTNTQTFTSMINSLKSQNIKIKVPQAGEQLQIGSAIITLLAPNSNTYEDLNNYSIVTKLRYGNTSFIFQGDAEDISESEILAKQLDISADVIRIGHHGSASSTTSEYLNKVNPKYAIISVGENNDYGHPNTTTLDKLSQRNITTYRTDINGTIIASSDGENIEFTATKDASEVNEIQNDNTTNYKTIDTVYNKAKEKINHAKETVAEVKDNIKNNLTEIIKNKIFN